MNIIPAEAAETALHKASGAAQALGSVVAVTSGTGLVLGLTTAQWSVVGIIGGLIVAFCGMVMNALVNWYFKNEQLKIARARANAWSPLGDE